MDLLSGQVRLKVSCAVALESLVVVYSRAVIRYDGYDDSLMILGFS